MPFCLRDVTPCTPPLANLALGFARNPLKLNLGVSGPQIARRIPASFYRFGYHDLGSPTVNSLEQRIRY